MTEKAPLSTERSVHIYPYTSEQDSSNYDFRPEIGSAFGFERTKLSNGSVYFVAPGLDVDLLLDSAHGPIIEVSGPTYTGFESLDNRILPSRPLITNIPQYNFSGNVINSQEVDFQMDAREFAVSDDSLSIILASCVMRTNYELANWLHENDIPYEPTVQAIYGFARKKLEAGEDLGTEMNDSVRIGFWVEAARTLKRNGLVLSKGMTIEDIALASDLGMVLVAHSSPTWDSDVKKPDFYHEPYEMIFQKVKN